jgi:hypothetical protein
VRRGARQGLPVRPSTRLKIGLKTALRRRYGYAALRALRRALVAAVESHKAKELGAAPYDGSEGEVIYRLYWQALQRLRKRWPDLDLEDDRAKL